MKIQKVTDASFKKYGRVLKDFDFTKIYEVLDGINCPAEVEYTASFGPLEDDALRKKAASELYGELSVEIGYCCGHNDKLNALEYHRSSEVNAAATDMILLLGSQADLTDDFHYDTAKVEAFLVPAHTAVELYATTLHFAPFGTKENDYAFKTAVILPFGTNFPLGARKNAGESGQAAGESRLLTDKNKWLIAHPEADMEGAYIGLDGKNICGDDLE